ncbi:HU family DNA-binding protein [Oceaniglobus trochenteri]|uniref:HU family DNA-binding protein n=1 Tax=Oceaniglobus trochenteri TaxID=2763260 RepID=UPI001CFF752A|nr:HU family DNA-binding protein [Oceaniglobus trochenteri]
MSNTTKTEIIAAIAEEHGIPKVKIGAVIDSFIDHILSSADAGNRVTLAGFGRFEMRTRAARTGRNPATGESIQIAESRALVFKASKPVKKP